jgi:hypothetical protein
MTNASFVIDDAGAATLSNLQAAVGILKGCRINALVELCRAHAPAFAGHLAAGLGCFDFIDLDTTFFLSGVMAHSPYLDDSGKFDLHLAGHGIGVEPPFP